MKPTGSPLKCVVTALESLAPLQLAEDWDAVGLQLDPGRRRPVKQILVTLDLTPTVLQEAIQSGTELVVSYHPPLFEALYQLRHDDPRERMFLDAARHGIAVYSPHTALDAVEGGLADWLCGAIGEGETQTLNGEGQPGPGPGRHIHLSTPTPPSALLAGVRTFLGVDLLQTAFSAIHRGKAARVKRVAICPGAGASLLLQTRAELLLTGEMKHHDVLAANARGASVILCGHAESERGYLKVFARHLRTALGGRVRVQVSRTDRGPLTFNRAG